MVLVTILISEFLGIKFTRFRRILECGTLRLRLLRIKDHFLLRSLFRREDLRGIGFNGFEPFHSLFSFCRWLISSIQVSYLVEIQNPFGGWRIVGFVGLYNMRTSRTPYLSVLLFDPKDRRQGHGRQALNLLFNFLTETAVAQEVFVEVLETNVSSIAFLQKLGFQVLAEQGHKILMVKCLLHYPWDTRRRLCPGSFQRSKGKGAVHYLHR
jgi:RimJ/RimL family protein N-acetyltransferase